MEDSFGCERKQEKGVELKSKIGSERKRARDRGRSYAAMLSDDQNPQASPHFHPCVRLPSSSLKVKTCNRMKLS